LYELNSDGNNDHASDYRPCHWGVTMQVLIDVMTRAVVAYGTFPTPPDDPAVRVVDMDDDAADALLHPGTKVLSEDGSLIVTPPDPAAQRIPGAQQRAVDPAAIGAALAALPDDAPLTKADLAPLLALFGVSAGQT
jgi:hypothetical protein